MISGAVGPEIAGQKSINTAAAFQGQSAVSAVVAHSGVALSGAAEIFTVNFQVIGVPESGHKLPLAVAYQEFFSTDLKRIQPAVSSGNVYLNTFLAGDINADGLIDLIDAFFLLRKLSGNLTAEQQERFFLPAADVWNGGDGAVNSADVSCLLRYITGAWEDGAPLSLYKATALPKVTA